MGEEGTAVSCVNLGSLVDTGYWLLVACQNLKIESLILTGISLFTRSSENSRYGKNFESSNKLPDNKTTTSLKSSNQKPETSNHATSHSTLLHLKLTHHKRPHFSSIFGTYNTRRMEMNPPVKAGGIIFQSGIAERFI